MIIAINLAKKHKAKLALIDQDIEITLKRFSKSFAFKEKWNLFVDILRGIFFKKQEMKKLGIKKLDLTKVPSKTLIKKMTQQVKKRYPSLYKVLIEERNEVLAHNLRQLIEQNPLSPIVAVIGAGHEEEVIKLIKKNTDNISYAFNIG